MHFVHLLRTVRARMRIDAAKQQIFPDAHVRKHQTAFRHLDDAELDTRLRRQFA